MARFLLLFLALTTGVFALNAAGPRTVIVFGDSITEGGALPKDQKEQLWVKLIEAQSPGALTIINEGKGGRPTHSLKEFEAMLQRRPKADALVIALGMNDSRDITTNCVPKAVANVRAMVERARQKYGAQFPVLLLGPTNINRAALGPTKPIGEQRETQLRELGTAFARLANEQHTEFESQFGIVPESSLLKDGVHPDAGGNAAIAKALGPRLRAWLATDR